MARSEEETVSWLSPASMEKDNGDAGRQHARTMEEIAAAIRLITFGDIAITSPKTLSWEKKGYQCLWRRLLYRLRLQGKGISLPAVISSTMRIVISR